MCDLGRSRTPTRRRAARYGAAVMCGMAVTAGAQVCYICRFSIGAEALRRAAILSAPDGGPSDQPSPVSSAVPLHQRSDAPHPDGRLIVCRSVVSWAHASAPTRQSTCGAGGRSPQCRAWRGRAWQAWLGEARRGRARQGRQGGAWLGEARRCEAMQGRHGGVGQGVAGHGMAGRRGAAWRGEALLGGARQAGLGKAWPGEARQARRG